MSRSNVLVTACMPAGQNAYFVYAYMHHTGLKIRQPNPPAKLTS